MWVKRMHGLKDDQKTEDNTDLDKVGAFAFMAPKVDDSKVSFALFDANNKENIEPSEMIVENLSVDENVPFDEPEDDFDPDTSSNASNTDAESDDSTYYDATEDDELDSFFVLVQPPSPISIDTVIGLTKSSSSSSEVSKVARMPTVAYDSYSDRDLFPSDSSDDEVVFVKT